MPSYLHKFTTEGEDVFGGWIYRGNTVSVALYTPEIPVARLAVVHCLEDNSRTLVFDREIPYHPEPADGEKLADGEEPTDIEAEMDKFVAEIGNPESYETDEEEEDTGDTALAIKEPDFIVEQGSDAVRLGIGAKNIGAFGLIIRHTEQGDPEVIRPERIGSDMVAYDLEYFDDY